MFCTTTINIQKDDSLLPIEKQKKQLLIIFKFFFCNWTRVTCNLRVYNVHTWNQCDWNLRLLHLQLFTEQSVKLIAQMTTKIEEQTISTTPHFNVHVYCFQLQV